MIDCAYPSGCASLCVLGRIYLSHTSESPFHLVEMAEEFQKDVFNFKIATSI